MKAALVTTALVVWQAFCVVFLWDQGLAWRIFMIGGTFFWVINAGQSWNDWRTGRAKSAAGASR